MAYFQSRCFSYWMNNGQVYSCRSVTGCGAHVEALGVAGMMKSKRSFRAPPKDQEVFKGSSHPPNTKHPKKNETLVDWSGISTFHQGIMLEWGCGWYERGMGLVYENPLIFLKWADWQELGISKNACNPLVKRIGIPYRNERHVFLKSKIIIFECKPLG